MSKKICFINYGNMYLAPYINNYLTCLKEDTSYDVIYWNRHNINEKINDNYFPFDFEVKDNCKNKFKKAIGYLKFSSFCKKLLKKNNYDVVIVLQSVGTVFLHNILVKKYKNKY